jgi:hypothetical protein
MPENFFSLNQVYIQEKLLMLYSAVDASIVPFGSIYRNPK